MMRKRDRKQENQKQWNRTQKNHTQWDQTQKNHTHWERIQKSVVPGRIPLLLGIIGFCMLCCSCGKKGGTILLGNTPGQSGESEITETGKEENVSTKEAGIGSSGASSGTEGGTSSDGSGQTSSGAGSGTPSEGVVRTSSGAETGTSSDSDGQESSEATIRVYVCGAVADPGVVEIPQGSRAEDALEAAGGFSGEAAKEAVNLAAWVNDGQKLYFPVEGEEVPPEASPSEAVPSSASPEAGQTGGLVNINTADVAALCTLPGMGESRAGDIIAYREANGGFDSCEDIMKVTGIKNAMYEKIKDKITVD